MALLAIETATRQMGVAVVEGDRVLSSYELLADYPHAVELPGAVRRVLEASGATFKTLEGFVIDIGPGSFTGLRIGLAFVKALAFVSQKPVVAVPSLEVLAAGLAFAPMPVSVILDARQKNVYAASFRVDSPQPVKQGEFFLGPIAQWLTPQRKQRTLFVGDGCAVYRQAIVDFLGEQALFAPSDCGWPKVGILGRLGAGYFAKGRREDAGTLVPLYLYPLDCSVRGPDRPTAVLAANPPVSI